MGRVVVGGVGMVVVLGVSERWRLVPVVRGLEPEVDLGLGSGACFLLLEEKWVEEALDLALLLLLLLGWRVGMARLEDGIPVVVAGDTDWLAVPWPAEKAASESHESPFVPSSPHECVEKSKDCASDMGEGNGWSAGLQGLVVSVSEGDNGHAVP